jgi:predicted NBD/HSP70 family sugar kinase
VLRENCRDAVNAGSAKPLTVQQAAQLSDISRPSVNNFYAPLVHHGKALEGLVQMVPDAGYVIGVDLRETHPVRVAVRDAHGRNLIKEPTLVGRGAGSAVYEDDVWSAEATTARPGASELLELAQEGIGQCTKDLDKNDLLGIGISLPGPVMDGFVVGPNANPWDLVQAGESLVRILGDSLPSVKGTLQERTRQLVVTLSDACASAVTEHLWGNPEAAKPDSVIFKWSFDLCAALILNGELYSGSGGRAGTIGHFAVEDGASEFACDVCGQKDCVHAVANLRYLSRVATGKDLTMPSAVAIRTALDDGHEATTKALKVAAKGLGVAASSYIAAVDPEAVVLGGAIGGRVFEAVQVDFMEQISNSLPKREKGNLTVVGATRTRNTAVLGAAACALLKLGPHRLKPFAEAKSKPKADRSGNGTAGNGHSRNGHSGNGFDRESLATTDDIVRAGGEVRSA